ncbi:MAG: acyl-CoA dehydrogenase, partial [Eggerthellaceae bacterium]|nr:acyl-CoA dehydrogenase [Eggerthellaceae bacterium]
EDIRVWAPGAALLNLMKGLEMERLFVACWSLGLAQAAMDDAAKYASQRVTFGKPIGNYQLVQERLCNMEAKLESARAWTYKALWDMDNGNSVRTESALLKRYVVDVCFEVCDDAMQIMGAIGYMDDLRISRLWLDTRGNRFAGGADDIMVHVAGRQLVKEYANK